MPKDNMKQKRSSVLLDQKNPQIPLEGGFFSKEIGDTFIELPIEQDFEGDSEGANSILADEDFGFVDKMYNSKNKTINLPTKKFKEDEDEPTGLKSNLV